jgi:hypothetical protein
VKAPAAATESTGAQDGSASGASAPGSDAQGQLQQLSSKMGAVQTVSDKDIQLIVAQHFGVGKQRASSTTEFDLPSAVFDSISRTTIVHRGKTYYGYQVNLVDQNGRHKTNIDCFAEPNPEYERSMATMDLINNSPQLKRIYDAMSSSLAEKSSSPTNQADSSGKEPALRLDPSK